MVSEMDSVKNVVNNVGNAANAAAYLANSSPQPVMNHTPQTVGVEFVRQYYTMLNRAPNLLFRFYNEDSTFVHGCLDKHGKTVQFVRGQKQIDSKITSMNFNNCHTKIRQVDSMETIGNGVVIQVIGELSNNGQPLRRFLQTFVLALQSPNKYYVRNDIFRYDDEVFTEETEGSLEKNDTESKYDSDMDNLPLGEPIVSERNYPYHSNGTMDEVRAAVAAAAAEQASIVDEGVDLQEEPESVQETSIEVNTSMADAIEDTDQLGAEEEEEEEEEPEPVSDVAMIVNQLSNEPKTYASMLSKSVQPAAATNVHVNKPVPVAVSPVPVAVNNHENIASVPEPPVVALTQPPVVLKTAGPGGFTPQRDRFIKKTGGGSGAFVNRRNESRESNNVINDNDSGDSESHFNTISKKLYPDENQLFIGNLLPNFSEEQLSNAFSRFGKIVDIRINRQSHKTNSNKASRNYGFITFESSEIIDQIISQKPIYHENHRYNVERKQGKSNPFERERNNQPPINNNSPRNGGSQMTNVSTNLPPPRHMQANSGRQGHGRDPGQPLRPRPGQSFQNSTNNSGGRSFVGGSQNYANRNNFVHQQNRS